MEVRVCFCKLLQPSGGDLSSIDGALVWHMEFKVGCVVGCLL